MSTTDASLEVFRAELAALDPAELTREDRIAMLEVLRQTFPE